MLQTAKNQIGLLNYQTKAKSTTKTTFFEVVKRLKNLPTDLRSKRRNNFSQPMKTKLTKEFKAETAIALQKTFEKN